MRRLVELLGSLRLTVALLVAVLTLFGLALAIPQRSVLRDQHDAWRARSPRLVAALDAAGLTDVHRSALAAGLWLAFFANLSLVMARRAPGTIRRVRIEGEVGDPATAQGFSYRAAIPGGEDALEGARRFFATKGYAIHGPPDRFRAVRFRLSPVATLAFHLSFFLVAAGAAATAATRFEGYVNLGEGERFTGALEQYANPPRLPRFGSPPASRFIVEGIVPEVVGDVPVGIRVHVRDDRFMSSVLEVNRPYRSGDASFVFKNLGVAPALLVTDGAGNEAFAGLIRLNVLMERTDHFTLLGREFTARFFPDYELDDGEERSRSQEMRNPVLRLETRSPDGVAIRAAMHPGEDMRIGSYTLAFVGWRYWVRLYVRAERGIGLVWIGFVVAAAALAVRLLLFRREWIVARSPGGGVRVAARAEYYRALFEDEAARVARELEEELARADAAGPA